MGLTDRLRRRLARHLGCLSRLLRSVAGEDPTPPDEPVEAPNASPWPTVAVGD